MYGQNAFAESLPSFALAYGITTSGVDCERPNRENMNISNRNCKHNMFSNASQGGF